MGWNSLILLMSDWRVQFLFWFVVAAMVVAGVLIYIDVMLRKKQGKAIPEGSINNSLVVKMQKFLQLDKSVKEKLNFVNGTAKRYFKEIYGTPINFSYSALAKKLGKNSTTYLGDSSLRENEIIFCRYMFAAYYSRKDLTDEDVKKLGNMLNQIEDLRKIQKVDSTKNVSSVEEKEGVVDVSESHNQIERNLTNSKEANENLIIEENRKKALDDAKKERELEIARMQKLKEVEGSNDNSNISETVVVPKEQVSSANSIEKESAFNENSTKDYSPSFEESNANSGVAQRIVENRKQIFDNMGGLSE